MDILLDVNGCLLPIQEELLGWIVIHDFKGAFVLILHNSYLQDCAPLIQLYCM